MDKTVLITGASRGIGAETARQFALAGCRVAINYYQSGDKAQALAEELGAQGYSAAAFGADVSEQEQVRAMVREVTDRFGPVDVLVNNAGTALQRLFTETTPEQWRRIFAIHVDGAFHCSQSVLPGMIRRKSGAIINVSSIWGLVGASCEVAYSASKAALVGLTKALAKEVGPSGIRVNCVAPGVIRTDMLGGLSSAELSALEEQTPLGRLGTPRDIARAIVFLASEEADFITGQVLSPNGGFVI